MTTREKNRLNNTNYRRPIDVFIVSGFFFIRVRRARVCVHYPNGSCFRRFSRKNVCVRPPFCRTDGKPRTYRRSGVVLARLIKQQTDTFNGAALNASFLSPSGNRFGRPSVLQHRNSYLIRRTPLPPTVQCRVDRILLVHKLHTAYFSEKPLRKHVIVYSMYS